MVFIALAVVGCALGLNYVHPANVITDSVQKNGLRDLGEGRRAEQGQAPEGGETPEEQKKRLMAEVGLRMWPELAEKKLEADAAKEVAKDSPEVPAAPPTVKEVPAALVEVGTGTTWNAAVGPGVPAAALVEVYTEAAAVVQKKAPEYTVTSFEDWMNTFSQYVFTRASPSSVLPVTFDSAAGSKDSTMTFLSIIGFKVPSWVQYVYPLVFFAVLVLCWFICCGAGNRKASTNKLSGKLLIETVMCYACLWADLATEHRVMSKARAWAYIALLVVLATLWNLFLVLYSDDEKTKHIVHLVFAPLVCFVWLVFAVERAFARKFFSRVVDKMSTANFCNDFLAHLFCAPYAILEEAKYLPQAQALTGMEKTAW